MLVSGPIIGLSQREKTLQISPCRILDVYWMFRIFILDFWVGLDWKTITSTAKSTVIFVSCRNSMGLHLQNLVPPLTETDVYFKSMKHQGKCNELDLDGSCKFHLSHRKAWLILVFLWFSMVVPWFSMAFLWFSESSFETDPPSLRLQSQSLTFDFPRERENWFMSICPFPGSIVQMCSMNQAVEAMVLYFSWWT